MTAAEWNSRHPVGALVLLTLADGAHVTTRTASAAQTWGGMSHVQVESIKVGYVPLDWVQALQSER